MITKIGLVAGEILNLLEARKMPMSISNIKLHLHEDMDVVNMGVSWLVREQYVCITVKGEEKYLSIPLSEKISPAT